jgi:transcriptional regulator
MYRPAHFAVDALTVLHEVISSRVFATIAIVHEDAVRFAYAPVIVDRANGLRGGIRFHLAGRNPVADLKDGTRVFISWLASDAYISPDWYRTLVTVPTWNYIAVEGEGTVERLAPDDLRRLLVDLSEQEERNLFPKKPWTLDKLPEPRIAALMNAIVGYSVRFERLEGKFKLSQDKSADDAAGAIEALEARGDPASLAVASAMRKHRAV